MARIVERRLIQIAAIAKACELDGIECSIRTVSVALGLKKSAHTNDMVKQAETNGFVKLLSVVGSNGLDMFIIVPTDHFIYSTITELVESFRNPRFV